MGDIQSREAAPILHVLLCSPHIRGEAELPDIVGQDIFQKQEYTSC